MNKDRLGNPVKVGDHVIYAKSSGDALHEATIATIEPRGLCTVRNIKTGRISANPRYIKDVVNITPLKDAMPELFI